MKELPTKGFYHKSGKFIPIPEDDFLSMDHSVFAAKNPKLFDTTESEMRKDVSNFDKLKNDEISSSADMEKFLNSRGYYRFTKSTEVFNEKDKDTGLPIKTRSHSIIISHESSGAEPEDFIEPLKHLKEHAKEVPKTDDYQISLLGWKSRKQAKEFASSRGIFSHPVGYQEAIVLRDLNSINKFIGESGGEVRRAPERPQQIPSQEQIRSAIGKKPEGMSQAEWNFYTRSESREFIGFTTLLEKIKISKRKK